MTVSAKTTVAPNTAAFLDTTIPNTARIFDYLAGGMSNFEVDRQAGEEMLKIIPSLRKWVRLRRAFIQEAAQRLTSDGYTQFLDLASGMPTEDHIHAFAPDARVVYSDINPVAVSYGDSLFADLVNVAYIRGNANELDQLLTAREVRRLIDREKRVAIGLNALFLFLSESESKTPQPNAVRLGCAGFAPVFGFSNQRRGRRAGTIPAISQPDAVSLFAHPALYIG
ncbi:MAG: hypothetical protein HF973_01040 [Chloroflexi bacterium]|nr:hypothetical protein [Chloroflexota bacterium]